MMAKPWFATSLCHMDKSLRSVKVDGIRKPDTQILTQTMPAKMRTIPSHWLRSSRSRRKIHESKTVTAP
jgi:hypothetical protein